MTTRVLCLDSCIFIAYFTPDEAMSGVDDLLLAALNEEASLIAPSFTWAEVGSVLRKKQRRSLLTAEEAADCYAEFCNLPIQYVDSTALQARTWQLAVHYQLPTLYDAAFLACAEQSAAEFWTADQALIRQLDPLPDYVHALSPES
jgi:predicted nucleic acid-binding protein